MAQDGSRTGYTHTHIHVHTRTYTHTHTPQLANEVGTIAPFLVPFLKMSCVYFVLWLPEDQPSITTAFVKILPVLSLVWFVCLQGITGGREYSYNRKILSGLILSSLGDALLVWQSDQILFLLGVACFSCAQISYSVAFGFSPLGMKELVVCATMLFVGWAAILPSVSGGIQYALLCYGLLLCTMTWRSLARFTLKGDIPWRKIYSAFGACLLAVSDTTLAVNKFIFPVPCERAVIMVTYYSAQLCFSLSVVNSRLYTSNEKRWSHDLKKNSNGLSHDHQPGDN